EGFAPLTAQIGVGEHKINQFVAHPRLSSTGTQAALDAINRVLGTSPYTQHVQLDAALWPALGLPTKPAAATLTSEQRFQAIALDPLQPTYFQTSYLRPIPPAGLGSVGVAAVVVEMASISGDCAATVLAQRTAPVVSTRRAEVIFSLARDGGVWR